MKPLRRELAAIAIAMAVLISSAAAKRNVAGLLTRRETVRELIAIANERGFADAPVFGLHTIERSAEFYAGGRYAYGSDGKPVKFEGVNQVIAAAREAGTILVLVPTEYEAQITGNGKLNSQRIGDNGSVALFAISLREPHGGK